MIRPLRPPSLIPAALLAALLAPATPQSAWAQVSTNTDALPPAEPPPKPVAKSRPTTSHIAPLKHQTSATAQQPMAHIAPAQRVGAPPDVPPKPPAPLVIPPPGVIVPTHPPVPATPVTAVADAKGVVTDQDQGLRVTFGPESADLNPAMLTALKERATVLAQQPTLRITLLAYAGGKPDDLSTPRRIALARVLNVRSILIAAGVATTRIYPRAIGLAPTQDDGAPDRLDLIAQGTVPVPASQAQFQSAPDGTPNPSPAPKATK